MYRAYRNHRVIHHEDGLVMEFDKIEDALAFLEMEYDVDIPADYTLGDSIYDDPENWTEEFMIREVTKIS